MVMPPAPEADANVAASVAPPRKYSKTYPQIAGFNL
jgi:hypothetical protein